MSFSKAEVNGVFILIPLIILLLFVPTLSRNFFGIEYSSYQEDKKLLDSLVTQINDNLKKPEAPLVIKPKHFAFDPNTVSVEELKILGVPGFLAGRVENYRSKGGYFSSKQDLLKIYDFPDSLFRMLEPYIRIPEKKVPAKTTASRKSNQNSSKKNDTISKLSDKLTEEVLLFDLNHADTSQLKRLKGIGTVYAQRIVAYRKLLGGFHSFDQLTEVYGMTDKRLNQLTPHLIISDTIVLRKVAINLATFKELLAHPYINYEQTKEILNLKSKQGKFRKPKDLFRLTLMDSSAIKKLLPYIRF